MSSKRLPQLPKKSPRVMAARAAAAQAQQQEAQSDVLSTLLSFLDALRKEYGSESVPSSVFRSNLNASGLKRTQVMRLKEQLALAGYQGEHPIDEAAVKEAVAALQGTAAFSGSASRSGTTKKTGELSEEEAAAIRAEELQQVAEWINEEFEERQREEAAAREGGAGAAEESEAEADDSEEGANGGDEEGAGDDGNDGDDNNNNADNDGSKKGEDDAPQMYDDYSDFEPLADGSQLIPRVVPGVLIARLLAMHFPETCGAQLRKIERNATNRIKQVANHNVTLDMAQRAGLVLVNIGATDLVDGNPNLVLSMCWQIIREALLKEVRKNMALAQIAEEEDLLNSVPPEQLLLRWFNVHLKNANWHSTVTDFDRSLVDSEAYLVLLHQLQLEVVPEEDIADALREKNKRQRAEMMLQLAERLGCRKFATPSSVCSGNAQKNLAFIANLFNKFPKVGPSAAQLSKTVEQFRQSLEEQTLLANELKTAKSEAEESLLKLSEQLESQGDRIDELTEEMSELQESLRVMGEREKTLLAERDALAADLEETHQQMEQQRKESESQQKKAQRIFDLKQQQLERQIEALSADSSTQDQRNQDLLQEVETLQQQLATESEAREEAEARVSQLEQETARLREELEVWKQKEVDCEENKAKLRTEIKSLRSTHSDSMAQLQGTLSSFEQETIGMFHQINPLPVVQSASEKRGSRRRAKGAVAPPVPLGTRTRALLQSRSELEASSGRVRADSIWQEEEEDQSSPPSSPRGEGGAKRGLAPRNVTPIAVPSKRAPSPRAGAARKASPRSAAPPSPRGTDAAAATAESDGGSSDGATEGDKQQRQRPQMRMVPAVQTEDSSDEEAEDGGEVEVEEATGSVEMVNDVLSSFQARTRDELERLRAKIRQLQSDIDFLTQASAEDMMAERIKRERERERLAKEKAAALRKAAEEKAKEMARIKGLLSETQQEGYVFKQGRKLHGWTKRYLVLRDNTLYFFLNENKAKERKAKPLSIISSDMIRVYDQAEPSSDRHKYFCLELVNKQHSNVKMIIGCPREEDRNAWSSAIKDAKNKRMVTNMVLVKDQVNNL